MTPHVHHADSCNHLICEESQERGSLLDFLIHYIQFDLGEGHLENFVRGELSELEYQIEQEVIKISTHFTFPQYPLEKTNLTITIPETHHRKIFFPNYSFIRFAHRGPPLA